MSLLRNFSHVYIEDSVADHPTAQRILERVRPQSIIPIGHYKEIFSRRQQNWGLQRASRKLVIARKQHGFLYPMTRVMPRFSHQHCFYNTLAMNCVYDCSYCYLAGMYPSANVVIFANSEDYFAATSAELSRLGSLYLCISYDTDLMALERYTGYVAEWLRFTERNPGLTIELRTKSASTACLEQLAPNPRAIIAWTLSPNTITDEERGAPTLSARIRAIARVAELGWPVRICLDPIIEHPDWQQGYRELAEELFAAVPTAAIHDVSLGVFRISKPHLKSIKEWRTDAKLLYHRYEDIDGLMTYDPATTSRLTNFVRNLLAQQITADKITITTGTEDAPASRSALALPEGGTATSSVGPM